MALPSVGHTMQMRPDLLFGAGELLYHIYIMASCWPWEWVFRVAACSSGGRHGAATAAAIGGAWVVALAAMCWAEREGHKAGAGPHAAWRTGRRQAAHLLG